MNPQDIYLKLEDPTGKHKPVVNQHRVWDAQRFVQSQQIMYTHDPKPEDRRIVSVSSRDEYAAQRGRA